MGRYVIRRLLQFIPTVLGTMFLLHYLTSVGIQLTGNPVRALFGDRQPPPQVIEAVTRDLHLDDPCLKQKFSPCLGTWDGLFHWDRPFGLFGERLSNIFLNWDLSFPFWHPDFGTNLTRSRQVVDIIGDAFPHTIKLTLIAFTLEILVGVTAGVLAGLRNGSFVDYFVKISTVLVIAVPVFVFGIITQQLGTVWFGNILRDQEWIPEFISRGVFGATYKPEFPFASLIIPGLVLAAISLASTARLTRTSMQENLRADFVRTAKAKGLTRRRVVGVHTLRNSLIPVVTNLGLSLAAYLGGAIVTERIFNVPGVGREVGRAVATTDVAILLGMTTVLVLVYLVITLLVDLLYAVLDPRIRYE